MYQKDQKKTLDDYVNGPKKIKDGLNLCWVIGTVKVLVYHKMTNEHLYLLNWLQTKASIMHNSILEICIHTVEV